MTRGKFITLEGPEGSGKSTHSKLIAEYIKSKGYEARTTREPGGTPAGEAIRRLLQHDSTDENLCDRTEVLLFEASRAQLVHQFIIPELNRGVYVVCDRFYDSTTAYQGYGRGFALNDINSLNRFAVGGLTPDLSILFDIQPEVGLARISARPGVPDRIERATLSFHKRVRDGYLELAAQNPERFAIVNTEKPQDVVQKEIKEILDRRLKFA